MMMFGIAWYMKIVNKLLLLIDTVLYALLAFCYRIFAAVSQVNLFDPNSVTYTSFVSRMYSIITIVAIFIFAYQMILMIANPDNQKNASPKFVKDLLISIIAVTLLPTIFNYMMIFQTHVINEGTIAGIILGGKVANDGEVASTEKRRGANIALMLLISNLYPNNTTYNDYFDANGNPYKDTFLNDANPGKKYMSSIRAVHNMDENIFNAFDHFNAGDIGNHIENNGTSHTTMHYNYLLSPLCIGFAIYCFVMYSFALGVRCAKLFFLQVIAPVPIMMRAFPNMQKSFDKWVKQVTSTYLEVFARMAFVYFCILAIQMVPEALNRVMSETSNSDMRPFVTLIIILGILKFMKDAPKLLSDLFGGGAMGDLAPWNATKDIPFADKFNKAIQDKANGAVGAVRNRASSAMGGATGAIGGALSSKIRGGSFRSGLKYGAAQGAKNGGFQLGGMWGNTRDAMGLKKESFNDKLDKLAKNAEAEFKTNALENMQKQLEDGGALGKARKVIDKNYKTDYEIHRDRKANELMDEVKKQILSPTAQNIKDASLKVDKAKTELANLESLMNGQLNKELQNYESKAQQYRKGIADQELKASQGVAGAREAAEAMKANFASVTRAHQEVMDAIRQQHQSRIDNKKKELDNYNNLKKAHENKYEQLSRMTQVDENYKITVEDKNGNKTERTIKEVSEEYAKTNFKNDNSKYKKVSEASEKYSKDKKFNEQTKSEEYKMEVSKIAEAMKMNQKEAEKQNKSSESK